MEQKRAVSIVVKCTCEGFAFDLTAELSIDQIEGLMKKLQGSGVEPANSSYLTTPNTSKSSGDVLAPLCAVHGTAMKPSKKGGGWYCPRKLDNGEYCKEKIAA